ncbi:MAG TPA: NAD(P)-dependent oxidoreductase, partial [Myxococcota bacterium]|nr:NAD(P)-dependent oxidoreductase [Myxococcota bacterium]
LARHNQVWAGARFRDAEARKALEAQGIGIAPLTIGDEDLSSLPDVDYVFHCAANTSPTSPDVGMLHNAEGVGFLMQRYRDAKGFLHMSSSSVYRVQPGVSEPTREDAELGGYSPYSPHYAASKLAGEAVARFQARALGLPTTIARLDVAYGAHGHGGVPMILYDMMKGGATYTTSEAGPSYCSMIHEDDISEQLQNLILAATVPATVVNLGGDEIVAVEEIIAWIEELTGLRMKVETAAQASWGMKPLDNARRLELGGPCKVPWKEGVRRSLAARHPDAIRA